MSFSPDFTQQSPDATFYPAGRRSAYNGGNPPQSPQRGGSFSGEASPENVPWEPLQGAALRTEVAPKEDSPPELTHPDTSFPSLICPNISADILRTQSPIKLGILASGNGSNFEAVAQAIKDGQLSAQIQVLIYNNPDAYAAVRAVNWGVPAVLLNHRDYKSREDLDRQIVQTLREYDVQWVVMAGWMRLVTSVLIDAFPDKIINIHPSLLPSFKGSRAVEQALAEGVKIAGCTVHLVCLEMDCGPILMQAAVPVLPDDTSETLHARIQVQEHRILPLAIALLASADF